MNIGTFTQTTDGYSGTLRTLAINAKAKFVPAEKKTDNSPDFRLVVGLVEVGAAWKRTSKDNDRPYLSVVLDDPSLPSAIYPRLVDGKNGDYDLIWSRTRD